METVLTSKIYNIPLPCNMNHQRRVTDSRQIQKLYCMAVVELKNSVHQLHRCFFWFFDHLILLYDMQLWGYERLYLIMKHKQMNLMTKINLTSHFIFQLFCIIILKQFQWSTEFITVLYTLLTIKGNSSLNLTHLQMNMQTHIEHTAATLAVLGGYVVMCLAQGHFGYEC